MRFLLKVLGVSLLGANVAVAGVSMSAESFKDIQVGYGVPEAKVKSLKDWNKRDASEVQKAAASTSVQQAAPKKQAVKKQQAPRQQVVQQQQPVQKQVVQQQPVPQQQPVQQKQEKQEENPFTSLFKGLATEVVKGAVGQAFSR